MKGNGGVSQRVRRNFGKIDKIIDIPTHRNPETVLYRFFKGRTCGGAKGHGLQGARSVAHQ
jgi:hypothetical protein